MHVHQQAVQLEQQEQTQEIIILHMVVQMPVVNPKLKAAIVLFVPRPLV